ncbi:MAG: 50S ribosomal protein L11 methyltransferase [Myxococcales bacterium]|nr:50S ribosomal protein L11 methyltransferase [Myxococcales bacterium]
MTRHLRIEVELGELDTDTATDQVSGALLPYDLTALAVEADSPNLRVSVSFVSGEPEVSEVQEALEQDGLFVLAIEWIEDAPIDWNEQWKIHFAPFRIGPLWVGPSWSEPDGDAEHVLRIDPGMAFGTGLHPTTRLCLQAIVDRGPAESILDVGVGSGILALASLKLGTPSAVGLDLHEASLEVARENARLNGLEDRLTLSSVRPSALQRSFPLVVANILLAPLIELRSEIAGTSTGRVLLSGILETQVAELIEAYEAVGLATLTVRTLGEWALVELGER